MMLGKGVVVDHRRLWRVLASPVEQAPGALGRQQAVPIGHLWHVDRLGGRRWRRPPPRRRKQFCTAQIAEFPASGGSGGRHGGCDERIGWRERDNERQYGIGHVYHVQTTA